jgi:hypothetical protein
MPELSNFDDPVVDGQSKPILKEGNVFGFRRGKGATADDKEPDWKLV